MDFKYCLRRLMRMNERLDEKTGLPLNHDGTVTLYQGVTAEKAQKIEKLGDLYADYRPDVYVTSDPKPAGYGDGTMIAFDIDPQHLIFNDQFPDGRKDYQIHTGQLGGKVPVKNVRVLPRKVNHSPFYGK